MTSPIDLLHQLIAIPSVNPSQAHTPTIAGELNIARFVGKFLSDLGAQVSFEGFDQDRPNVIARFAPLDGRPRILLGPHLDTVGTAHMTIPPFGLHSSGQTDDDKIWGRGSSDTKGTMAAMLTALAAHADKLSSSPVAIDFVAFADEEFHQQGSQHFAKQHAGEYQLAIVGEPTSLQFVNQTKGCCILELTSHGRAAHAANPTLGENAITNLVAAVQGIVTTWMPWLCSEFHHPILGNSTLNIGLIEGGSQANMVPVHAKTTLDCRFTPACHQAGGPPNLLREFLNKSHPSIELSVLHHFPPMFTSPTNPWMAKLLQHLPQAECVGAPWFSDAAHLAAAGVPSICAGPGSIDQAHTADEFILRSDYEQGCEFFTKLIAALQIS